MTPFLSVASASSITLFVNQIWSRICLPGTNPAWFGWIKSGATSASFIACSLLCQPCHFFCIAGTSSSWRSRCPSPSRWFIQGLGRSVIDAILAVGYNTVGTVEVKEQRSILNQRPDRFLARGGSNLVVWEDKAWNVFEAAAPKILTLATSDQGRSLAFGGMEEHERAMVYQIAVAAYDRNVFWGLLFGGNHALLFQRVASAEPTRYGLLCSDEIPVQDLFSVVLALLLVPGSAPLVDTASFMAPTPAPCPPGDILTREGEGEDMEYENKDSLNILKSSKNVKVIFRVPGYQPTIVSMSRLPASPDTTPASPPLQSPPDPPPVLTPPQETAVPTLHICELLSIGATGIVFKATGGSMALVVKAIPPGWTGDGDLRNEALMYDALASLQGSALPRMAGCFQGKGWTILVIEDCGRSVTAEDLPFLSLEQRRMLWRHACSIHGSGIVHHDLEPRNLVVSSSGEVRVIDFAFARAGHVCQQISCTELESFQKLLGLDYLPETINLLV
ncbi:hypothetical protein FB451DRAFT_373959, partial [Mycena latifolia]